MRKLETKVLEPDDTVSLMKSITPERCQPELQEVGGTDFGFAFGKKGRFRIAVFKQKSNVSLVLRLIPSEFLTFEQLGTPEAMHELIKRPRGLILVTGPTGSGKTTTLHTTGAEGTVNRIIDVFPTNQQEQIRTQLSVAIIGILSQALLPRQPKGMVAAYEMLTVTPAVSNLIRENKTYRISSTIQTGKKHGMIGLDESLFNLWRNGSVLEQDVLEKAHKVKELQEKIPQAKQGIFTDDEDEDVFEDEDEEGGSEES